MRDAVLTINVIVFGVHEQALPALVPRRLPLQARRAETVWRG